jgi:hypothetical protein
LQGVQEAVVEAFFSRTRHTFSRLVAEQTGRLGVTQDALDHVGLPTTRI